MSQISSAHENTIEATFKPARKELPRFPIGDLLGFKVTKVEDGQAVVEFQASSDHANPMGTLHGGVLCDIADAAMGVVYAHTLAPGESFTTLELKINFLKPVWNDKLKATAKIIKKGQTVSLLESEVFNEAGQLVAYVTSTVMTLRGEHAKGR